MDDLLELANLHPIEILNLKVHYPSLDKKGLNPVHTCNENAKASVNKDVKYVDMSSVNKEGTMRRRNPSQSH